MSSFYFDIANDEAMILLDRNHSFYKAFSGKRLNLKRVYRGESTRPIQYISYNHDSERWAPKDLLNQKTGRISLRRQICSPRVFEAATSDGQKFLVHATVNFCLDRDRLEDTYHTEDFCADFLFRIIESFRGHIARYPSKSLMQHRIAIQAQVGINLCDFEGQPGVHFHEIFEEEARKDQEEEEARWAELEKKLEMVRGGDAQDEQRRRRIEQLERDLETVNVSLARAKRIAARALDMAKEARKRADNAESAKATALAKASGKDKPDEDAVAGELVMTNALGIKVFSVGFDAVRQYPSQQYQRIAALSGDALTQPEAPKTPSNLGTAAQLGPLIYDDIADIFREADEKLALDDKIIDAILKVLGMHTQQRVVEALSSNDNLVILTSEEIGATTGSAARDLVREVVRNVGAPKSAGGSTSPKRDKRDDGVV